MEAVDTSPHAVSATHDGDDGQPTVSRSRPLPWLEREGATVAYEVRGSGDAVLLCQGAGVAGCGWRPQVEALSDYLTITFDNRGFGASKPGPKRASIEDLAADALAVLDAVGVERAHVVGHSMGGLVAQAIALAAPGRVRSLSLLCTVHRGPVASRPSFGVILTSVNAMLGGAALTAALAAWFLFIEVPDPAAESTAVG